jgi:hypothetical protein
MKTSLSKMRSEVTFGFDDKIYLVLIAILFALAQRHLAHQALHAYYGDTIREAKLVFLGTPTWRVYQSRVLGPYIVQALSYPLRSYESAYELFNVSCLTVAGYLSYFAGTLINRQAGGIVSFLLFQCLFALLLNGYQLFVWDVIGVTIFYAFLIIVIRGLSWKWTVLLFAVAILNRESGLFIALWLLADPVCRWGLGRLGYGPKQPLDIYAIAAGAACMVLGILAIEALRTSLLIEELGNKTLSGYGAHAFLPWQWTINTTISAAHSGQHLFLIVPAFVAVMLYLLVRTTATYPSLFLSLAVVWLAQLVALMIVGFIYETRVLIECIPFVGIATILLLNKNKVLVV